MIRLVVLLVLALALEAGAQTFPAPGPGHAPWLASGGGGGAWASTWGACTAGVDCYCDRVQGTGPLGQSDPVYNSGIVFCDDYDHDQYYALNPTNSTGGIGGGNIIATPSGQSNNRGGNSYARLRYGAVSSGVYWTEGQPTTPTYGSPCTSAPSGCGGYKVWHATNQWNANSYNPQWDIIRSGEFGVESGSTAPTVPGAGGAEVFGNASFGHRVGAGSTSGTHGIVNFASINQIGVTMAMAFESNVVASGVLNGAWKFDESFASDAPAGEKGTSWIGFRQTNGDVEYFPMVITLQSWAKGGIPNCTARGAAAQASATKGEIYVNCGTPGDKGFMIPRATHADYTFSGSWDLSKWHCIQTYADMRTIGSTRIQMWLDGVKLIDFYVDLTSTDYDTASGTDGIRGFEMNSYSNVGETSGNSLTTRRYADNYTIRNGSPVSCNDAGFALIAD